MATSEAYLSFSLPCTAEISVSTRGAGEGRGLAEEFVHFLLRSYVLFKISLKRRIFCFPIGRIHYSKFSSLRRDNEPFENLKGQNERNRLMLKKRFL
jgi:hypothetical protein